LITEYKNGYRVIASSIPSVYNERIGIEGRASLVIGNITLQDNTTFRCILGAEQAVGLLNHTSTIRVIVTGMVRYLRWLYPFLVLFSRYIKRLILYHSLSGDNTILVTHKQAGAPS